MALRKVTARLVGKPELAFLCPELRVLDIQKDGNGFYVATLALGGEVVRLRIGDSVELTLATRFQDAS